MALERAELILESQIFKGEIRPNATTLLQLWLERFGGSPPELGRQYRAAPVVLSRHGALWWPARLSSLSEDEPRDQVRIDFFGEPPTYEYVTRSELIPFSRAAAVRRSPEPKAPCLQIGSRVEARWRGNRWFKAHVTQVHTDGSFDVAYQDGEKEARINPAFVRPQSIRFTPF